MLQLLDVGVRYENGATGIERVSLKLRPGEVVAVFGANGAGKSSTVRAASGFLKSERVRTSGRVLVEGDELANAEPYQFVNAGVAAIPERRKIFPNLTVRDNLRALRGGRSDHSYSSRLEQVLTLFPVLAERQKAISGRLSGGEQQMLAIARGAVLGVRYLLIDEMTLGLHPDLRPPLFRAIKQLSKDGTGILIVDENVAEALQVADYCYLLLNGTTNFAGPCSKFAANRTRMGLIGG